MVCYLQCCDQLKLVRIPALQGLVFTGTEHQVSVGDKLCLGVEGEGEGSMARGECEGCE